jgi:hypothetical protein
MESWEPTGRGGLRRLGVAQNAQSAAQITRRSERRALPPGPVRAAWAERLGLPSCPYVIRWRLEIARVGSVRVHRWLGPDDDRAYHDHPWWFITIVVKGGYTDISPGGGEHLRAPAIRFRPALHRHTVVPDKGGAWTVMITGPKTRAWGFWLNGKLIKANKWFASRGHHPCGS